MDEDTFQTNLNSVMEMILDENKLVTYISISKDLCLHVNESKSLLFQIVDNIRRKQPDVNLNVNYIISGLADKHNARTTVCSEVDMDDVKQTLKIIFFQHIYSVGKGSASVDGVAYMAINRFEDFPLCTGLIKSSVCTKRTLHEIGNLKSNSQDNIVNHRSVDTKSAIPQKKTKENNDKSKTTEGENTQKKANGQLSSVVKVHATKSEPTIKAEPSSPKKDKINQHKAQKGIAGFFNKANSVPAKQHKNNLNKNTVQSNNVEKGVNVKVEKMNVDSSNNVEKGVNVKVEKMDVDSKTPVTNKEQSNKGKPKFLTDIKKNVKIDKKRKRVLHVSDSESEDEKNDPFGDDTSVTKKESMESDDEIPPTPTVNTVKITSGIVNPKKRRKIVDKTYTDEDGYILTKKEEVYESCSENEADLDPKEKENVKQVNQVRIEVSPIKKNGSKNKKKVSPPQKGKQATLMNFFKKV